MTVLFWAVFLVILVPLAEGVLLALLLREIHVRHPLPLVEPGYVNAWSRPKPKNIIADSVEPEETTNESAADTVEDNGEFTEPMVEENVSAPGEIDVFDGSANVPKDLPVNDVLDSMIATVSETIPDAFESRIEESTRLQDGLSHEMHHIEDDLDFEDLQELAAALPKTKIDFAQEDEMDSGVHEAIAPMAKELLGENFDFVALEQQAKEAFESLAPTEDPHAEVAFDVQEDASGVVQVSSPFLCIDLPQSADFSTPQMVLPIFSDDWVQESGNTIEPTTGDASNFCFTAESQPMFVRKRKAVR